MFPCLKFFPVCSIYRSPRLCDCRHMVLVWLGIWELHDPKEILWQLFSNCKSYRFILHYNVLIGCSVHFVCHVSSLSSLVSFVSFYFYKILHQKLFNVFNKSLVYKISSSIFVINLLDKLVEVV